MILSYEQGETIAFVSEGKTSGGALMVEADLVGITCTGSLQRIVPGTDKPDNSATIYTFQDAPVAETATTGAGFRLTLSAGITIGIEPGTYVYERTITQVGGHTLKTQRLIQIKGSIK